MFSSTVSRLKCRHVYLLILENGGFVNMSHGSFLVMCCRVGERTGDKLNDSTTHDGSHVLVAEEKINLLFLTLEICLITPRNRQETLMFLIRQLVDFSLVIFKGNFHPF